MNSTIRVFVGFFGITRGLVWTAPSIEKNIFEPLRRSGCQQWRFAHFNRPDRLQSPRTGEVDLPFEMGDVSALKLDSLLVTEQNEANIKPYFDCVMKVPFKGESDEGGATRKNSLHQLYSLNNLANQYVALRGGGVNAVFMLRPDLRYIDRFPVKQIFSQLKGCQTGSIVDENLAAFRRRGAARVDVVVPFWQSWGGLNDRYAVCTAASAEAYMRRIELVPEFCDRFGYYHPESLLKFALEKAGLQVGETWPRAERIRSDGCVAKRDEILTKNSPLRRILNPIRSLMNV